MRQVHLLLGSMSRSWVPHLRREARWLHMFCNVCSHHILSQHCFLALLLICNVRPHSTRCLVLLPLCTAATRRVCQICTASSRARGRQRCSGRRVVAAAALQQVLSVLLRLLALLLLMLVPWQLMLTLLAMLLCWGRRCCCWRCCWRPRLADVGQQPAG